ncbi:MAG: hypothetical protein IPK82_19200 [Polyangiaceae bacterium]|nr:hypothetical protein [Polyangiaceae bacterium]
MKAPITSVRRFVAVVAASFLLPACGNSSAPGGSGAQQFNSSQATSAAPPTSAASATASGTPSSPLAADNDLPFPDDPPDELAKIARLMSDTLVAGWHNGKWHEKYIDTQPQRDMDKQCDAKNATACYIAAVGYSHRGLEILELRRANAGCKLGSMEACVHLYDAYLNRSSYSDRERFVSEVVPAQEDTPKYILKNLTEMCTKGFAAACFLEAKIREDEYDKSAPRMAINLAAYQKHKRACALGAASGCWLALHHLREKPQVENPEKEYQQVVRYMERLCLRRAGACERLASELAPRSPQDTVFFDKELAKKLEKIGCENKSDITYERDHCN